MTTEYTFFATTPKGMEPLLAAELQELGVADVIAERAGASFRGGLAAGYRACLWSRLASRILLPLAQFPAATPDELYAGVSSISWDAHLTPDGSLAVDCNANQSKITHTHFAALKVKDAVVDQFRAAYGTRPEVDLKRPDLRLNLNLWRNQARLSLDLSGASLHRRGYRGAGKAAPLKENLAAAILQRAGWPEIARAGGPLLDPMCGSGTLPIEAALMAGDVAPGLERDYFGFLHWLGHDGTLWEKLLQEARERRQKGLQQLPRLVGYDVDRDAVRTALAHVERAGLQGLVHIERRDLGAAQPPDSGAGLLVVNPPYGERMGDEIELVGLYERLGHLLKQRFADWHAAVFSGNPRLRIGLRPRRSYTLYNGALECRLSLFRVALERRTPTAANSDSETKTPERSAGLEMLENRLRKNLRILGRWARRGSIDCYRLYDADLPEYNLAVDLYRGEHLWAHVQEYQAPYKVDPSRAARRRQEALDLLPGVLDIPPQHLFFKVRQRQKGRSQYEKMGASAQFREVREDDARFLVNFTDYLDTGLFLDHRLTREIIRSLAAGRSFLNLFGYTGTATVQAALGSASGSTTVDLSRTYLEWARRNLVLNDLAESKHQLLQADCLEWLQQAARGPGRRYGLIFLDPPTFSTSKRMQNDFDVQRDHVDLILKTARLLERAGVLLFSTNNRKFKLDRAGLKGLNVEDMTRATLPRDFERNPRIHHCWKITW